MTREDKLREWRALIKQVVREIETEYGSPEGTPIAMPLVGVIAAMDKSITAITKAKGAAK